MMKSVCDCVVNILQDYYEIQNPPPLDSFILPSVENKKDVNCVLVQEIQNEIFLGIQFEKSIFEEIDKKKFNSSNDRHSISLHTAAIIAEEISHFIILFEAAQNEKSISQLNLEILGEIDRFLCLMHWNIKSTECKLIHNWKNLHNICDYVFQGNRFIGTNTELYIQAENLAFHHIKNAFSSEWDQSHFDFENISSSASLYFNELRKKFFCVR